MGYADIGPFGAEGYERPNLDRMAQEGVRFTRTLSYEIRGVLALLSPFLDRQNRRISGRALENLTRRKFIQQTVVGATCVWAGCTIGTFKAFNHIWVMKELTARETVDTASIVIFRTFRGGWFGEAAAMAFILFGIILTLSQIQRRVGERMVFYG